MPSEVVGGVIDTEVVNSGATPLAGTQASFRTHANYLRAFTVLAGVEANETALAALERLCHRAAPVLHGNAESDGSVTARAAEAFSCLNRAWGTELVLNISRRVASEDELVRLTNSWGSVQAYYAAYGATQALIVAEGRARPTNHQATQSQMAPLWVSRRSSLAPWSFAMAEPGTRSAAPNGAINGPDQPISTSLSNLVTCTPRNSWDLAAMALRSTRERAVADSLARERTEKLRARKRRWRAESAARLDAGLKPRQEPVWPTRQNLTPDETSAIRARVRPYTLLDYLFRLRIKANYEDARMFTEGPVNSYHSHQVAQDLVRLTSATLLVHELRIGRILGRSVMLAAINTWLAQNAPPGRPMALALRRDLLQAHLRP